jgi:HD-like signal output (HDOD) protein
MTLEDLLHNPKALPTAPKIVADLISSFEHDNVSNDEIARKLSTDPVLSAKVLRLANCAYYGLSFRIGTVDQALQMLGFGTVRTLVISSALVSGFRTAPGIDLKRFWRFSLHTAVGAKWIANKAGEDSELAFTIGLMHAIGLLIIHSAMPEQAQELSEVSGPFDADRMAQEKIAFGYTNAEVGAELARRWRFPPAFSDAIRDFPDAFTRNGMAAAIHLGVWRAMAEEHHLDAEMMTASFPGDAADTLGLSAGVLLTQMPTLTELSAGLEELLH